MADRHDAASGWRALGTGLALLMVLALLYLAAFRSWLPHGVVAFWPVPVVLLVAGCALAVVGRDAG